MFFIDKDQRITSWQINITSSKPQSPLLSCLPFFHHDLNCFVQWHTSLALTNRPYIHRLFLFFLPPRFALFIFLFYRIAVSSLSNSVSMWSLGQHVCRFSPAIAYLSSFWCFGNLQNHPVSLKIYASLLIANSKSILNIKSRRHPT